MRFSSDGFIPLFSPVQVGQHVAVLGAVLLWLGLLRRGLLPVVPLHSAFQHRGENWLCLWQARIAFNKMRFQPRAQSAAPNTGSMGSCDYWCKGKSVLRELMLVFFPGQREKSDVCMGCQAEALHTAAVPLAAGEGAGSSPAVGRRSCALLGVGGIFLKRSSPALPHSYESPSPISAFLPSLHKAAVQVPRFLERISYSLVSKPQSIAQRCGAARAQQLYLPCPLLTFQGWERCLYAGSSVLGKWHGFSFSSQGLPSLFFPFQ